VAHTTRLEYQNLPSLSQGSPSITSACASQNSSPCYVQLSSTTVWPAQYPKHPTWLNSNAPFPLRQLLRDSPYLRKSRRSQHHTTFDFYIPIQFSKNPIIIPLYATFVQHTYEITTFLLFGARALVCPGSQVWSFQKSLFLTLTFLGSLRSTIITTSLALPLTPHTHHEMHSRLFNFEVHNRREQQHCKTFPSKSFRGTTFACVV